MAPSSFDEKCLVTMNLLTSDQINGCKIKIEKEEEEMAIK
jgi:hypothetical protein